MRSVIIVGLDGFDTNILDSLPSLDRIMVHNGVATDLLCFPPFTPIIWTSISTGVNLKVHGIWGFYKVWYKDGVFLKRLACAHDVAFPRFWDIAVMHDRRVRVFAANVPLLWPVLSAILNRKASQYVLVPGWDSEDVKCLFLGKLITDDTARYTVNDLFNVVETPRSELLKENRIHDVASRTEERLKRWIEIIDDMEPDIAFVIISEIDWLRHKFREKAKVYGAPVFQVIDRFISEAKSRFDTLLFCSDHGFSRYSCSFNIHSILMRHGFERVQYNDNRPIQRLTIMLTNALGARSLCKFALRFLSRSGIIDWKRINVDISSSKAFILETPSMIIYHKPGIEKKLLGLLDRTGVVKGAIRLSDYALLLVPRQGYWFMDLLPSLRTARLIDKRHVFAHHPRGFFAVYSDRSDIGFRECACSPCRPEDVAATALALAGFDVPSELEGRVPEFIDVPVKRRWYGVKAKWPLLKRIPKV